MFKRGLRVNCFLNKPPTHPDARHVVAACVVVSASRGPLGAGAHAVAVVFTHEDAWHVPQLCHVVRLEQLTLVGSSVPVQGETHGVYPSVLGRKGDSYPQWYLQKRLRVFRKLFIGKITFEYINFTMTNLFESYSNIVNLQSLRKLHIWNGYQPKTQDKR